MDCSSLFSNSLPENRLQDGDFALCDYINRIRQKLIAEVCGCTPHDIRWGCGRVAGGGPHAQAERLTGLQKGTGIELCCLQGPEHGVR